MGQVFALAKECMDMPLDEIEALLASPEHPARVGAVSVMDFQARSRKTSPEQKQALFDLYLRRHDLIDTWDLVDRSAIWVVGEHLRDKPRDVLNDLDLVHKAVGWMLREAGKQDQPRLRAFLDAHAATMPRVMLRYSIEKLEPDVRRHYLDQRRRP